MSNLRLLFACLLTSLATLTSTPVSAQITPDQTLGDESSIITSDIEVKGAIANLIEGGATRGPNLFHSFLEFNIGDAERVYFQSPSGIESIISRVTGSNASSIAGILGTTNSEGVALTLINPNGIVFEGSARLDVQGAFTATTAADVRLGDEGLFSAVSPERDNLLSVQPSAFFFNSLSNQGNISFLSRGDSAPELQVPNGESLVLLGRNLSIDGGQLDAWEGKVSLGAVQGAALVTVDDGLITVPTQSQRGDILLQNGASIDVRLSTAGDVQLFGDNISILSGSRINAGIESGFGTEGSQAGDVHLSAAGAIAIDDALIVNIVGTDAVGNAGDIQIDANEVQVTKGSQLITSTAGQGNVGDVVIRAKKSVVFEGTSADNAFRSAAFSVVDTGAEGQGGNVEIVADNISFINGALVTTGTLGTGDSGSVLIRANNNVSFRGRSADGRTESDALSRVGTDGIGQGGNIEIVAKSLSIEDGGQLIANTGGAGSAGNVILQVQESIELKGRSDSGELGSGIASNVTAASSQGQGGNIDIAANSVTITDGAQLTTSTQTAGDAGNISIRARDRVLFSAGEAALGSTAFSNATAGGDGNAGNIEVTARSILIEDGSQLISSNDGSGDAGNITFKAQAQVVLDGRSADGQFGSGAFSDVDAGSTSGKGGDIDITASSVDVTGGAQLIATTKGASDAGNIFIRASDRVLFDGRSEGGQFSSNAVSGVLEGGLGDGGDIKITAKSLLVKNGALLSASTSGTGDAGDITFNIQESVVFDDGVELREANNLTAAASIANSGSRGKGGDINISAGSVSFLNGAIANAGTSGVGKAGSVLIDAQGHVLFSGLSANGTFRSSARSSVNSNGVGRGGNINITAQSLLVEAGAQLSSSTSGNGRAGNITLKVREDVVFDGLNLNGSFGSSAFSTVGTNGVGRGGDITVEARSITVAGLAQLGTSTFGEGDAGDLTLQAKENIVLNGLGLNETFGNGAFSSVAATGRGSGGDIQITTADLLLTNGASLDARTEGRGSAGRISVDATSSVTIEGAADTGLPSNVLTITDIGSGAGGDIRVTTPRLSVANGAIVAAETNSAERSGDITINASNIEVLNGGQIAASSNGEGAAGNLTINGDQLSLDGAILSAESATVDGGNIDINLADSLVLRNSSQITATAGTDRAGGNGGNIDITAPVIVAIPDENSDITANAFSGEGGRVNLQTRAVFGVEARNELTAASDITASSNQGVDGAVVLEAPDTGRVENSVTDLPQDLIQSDGLLASSCITQREGDRGTFVLNGRDRPSTSPADSLAPAYSTGTVQPIATTPQTAAIQEPQALYSLADGRLVIGHLCE